MELSREMAEAKSNIRKSERDNVPIEILAYQPFKSFSIIHPITSNWKGNLIMLCGDGNGFHMCSIGPNCISLSNF